MKEETQKNSGAFGGSPLKKISNIYLNFTHYDKTLPEQTSAWGPSSSRLVGEPFSLFRETFVLRPWAEKQNPYAS